MLSQVEKLLLRKKVDFILHVPGNYQGGILEMTFVLDAGMPPEMCKQMTQDIIQTLKSQSEIFRNVRLNVINWNKEEHIEQETVAMPILQMGTYFDSMIQIPQDKKVDSLIAHLKLFHARSKLIIVISNKEPVIGDANKVMTNLNPFIKRKILWIAEKKIIDGNEMLQLCMK